MAKLSADLKDLQNQVQTIDYVISELLESLGEQDFDDPAPGSDRLKSLLSFLTEMNDKLAELLKPENLDGFAKVIKAHKTELAEQIMPSMMRKMRKEFPLPNQDELNKNIKDHQDVNLHPVKAGETPKAGVEEAAMDRYQHLNFKPTDKMVEHACKGMELAAKHGRLGQPLHGFPNPEKVQTIQVNPNPLEPEKADYMGFPIKNVMMAGVHGLAKKISEKQNLSPEEVHNMHHVMNNIIHKKDDMMPDGTPSNHCIAYACMGGQEGHHFAHRLKAAMSHADMMYGSGEPFGNVVNDQFYKPESPYSMDDINLPASAADESAKGNSSDYLIVEDSKKSSTWHLPVKKNGKPDHRLMGGAWAALHGGYRGNKYEGPKKAEAIKKLKALYKSEGLPLPSEK